MISDIPWADVGKAIGDSLIWVLGRLNEAAENADWVAISESLFRGLTEMILNIDWLKLVGLLGEWLINCFVMSVDIVLGALAGIFHAIGDALEEAGHDVIGGFFKGVGNAFAGIGQWLHEHIFDPFINAWKALWQIGSPSKVMEEQGGFIVSGLFNGISAAWHFVTDFFGDALDGLKLTFGGAWNAVKEGASTAWNGISTTLSGVWNHIKTNASTSLSELGKTASGKWQGLRTDASKAWNDLKTAVGQTISSVKQEAVSKVSETVNSIKPQWARIKTDAVSEWNGLKSSVVSSALSLKTQVASAFQSLQGTLSGVWSGIRSAASGALSSVSAIVSSMVTSISSRVSSIRTTVSNITSSASDALSKVANKMDDLTRKTANTVTIGGLASGGVVTNGGHIRSWYDSVRKYASGTARAAGSLFVAGESGPEIVGHVNGRTEVLNESQIASAIYSAVLAAMREAVSTLGGFLSQQMASNTNALIAAIGQIQAPPQIAAPQDTAMLERLAALQAVPYQVPAYATGTVMPYEVAAEIRRSTDKITGCIDSNTEELIKTMIGAFSSQTAALVSALSALKELSGQQRDASFGDIKDAANVWTQMYGKSPFYG